jgi:hypothetical protein
MPMFLKVEIFQINDQQLHLKKLGNQKQTKHKISRWGTVIKIRVEINEKD